MRPKTRRSGTMRAGRIDPGLVILIGGALLIGALYAFRSGAGGPGGGAMQASSAVVPPLALVRGNGSKVPLLPPGAKGAVVHLWGPWCNPCLRELPMWQKMQEKLDPAKTPLRLISCGFDMPESLVQASQEAAAVLRTRAPALQTFFDPSGEIRTALLSAAGSDAFPTTIVLNYEGKIEGVWIGAGGEEQILSAAAKVAAAPGEVPAPPVGKTAGPATPE